jgi:hypothetical protein
MKKIIFQIVTTLLILVILWAPLWLPASVTGYVPAPTPSAIKEIYGYWLSTTIFLLGVCTTQYILYLTGLLYEYIRK